MLTSSRLLILTATMVSAGGFTSVGGMFTSSYCLYDFLVADSGSRIY